MISPRRTFILTVMEFHHYFAKLGDNYLSQLYIDWDKLNYGTPRLEFYEDINPQDWEVGKQ